MRRRQQRWLERHRLGNRIGDRCVLGRVGCRLRLGEGLQRPPIRASGPAGLLFRSLNGIELNEGQKATLEEISKDLRRASEGDADGGGGTRTEMKEIHAELVAGVKAGKLDKAKIDAHEAVLEKAARARRIAEAEALNKVQKMLDTTQRKAAVTAVRGVEEKRAARMKRHAGADAGLPNLSRLKFEHYIKDLDLDAEQQKKVTGMFPKDERKPADEAEEATKLLDSVLSAFDKDDFDARRYESADALKKRLVPTVETARFFAQLVPTLKPEQREKLAAKLEKERSNDGHPRRRGPERSGHDYQEEDEALDW